MPWRPQADPRKVCARDGFTCQCCGLPGTEVHHIHWRSDGGSTDASNLITLCDSCHKLAPRHDAFLGYQRAGGSRQYLLGQLSPGQRTALYLSLPYAPEAPAAWHRKRLEWLLTIRVDLNPTPTQP